MGVRENKVETYLDEQIEKHHNGITRKWVSPGHDGVMDRICFIGQIWFVEVKTVDGVHESHQIREAHRLMNRGARVAVVFGHTGVDSFIDWLRINKHVKAKVLLEFR